MSQPGYRRFYAAVRQLVRMVPPGKVASYGQIATYLGHPRHARIVGWVLHDLPADTDVPWQRIVNMHGRITTTCLTHPANLQRLILEEEGVSVNDEDCVDMSRYRWQGPTDAQWQTIEATLQNPAV